MASEARVVSLHRYPIKSCRGIDLDHSVVERRGLPLDRRFMVVDDDGTFRTQRKDPRLALVDVAVEEDQIRVTAVGHGEAVIDLGRVAVGPTRDVRVWQHEGAYPDQGDDVATFFSDLLDAPSRVVYMPDDATRLPNPQFAASPSDRVSFADGFPLLVTSTASLAALQERMDEPVPMGRFRANIVVDRLEPWAEDDWARVMIGDLPCVVAKACARCVITTTDQRTGERFAEPLRTLGQTRRTPAGVTFGVYLIPLEAGVEIALGAGVRA